MAEEVAATPTMAEEVAATPTQEASQEDVTSSLPEGCATWQRTGLMIAARHGQVEVVHHWLESSAKLPQLDSVDDKGDTAVIIAARYGHLDVVKALVDAGADLSVRDAQGLTAAEVAATEDIQRVVKEGEEKYERLRQVVLHQFATGPPAPHPGGAVSSVV